MLWGEIGTMRPSYIRPRWGILAVMLLLISCTANVGLVPPEQMRPRELATYAMGVYNQQYDNFMQKVTLPNLSDAEKGILKIQKQSLTNIWPILKTYVWYVDHDQYPPGELQTQLLTWLNSVRY